jgi:hypothetical protein
VTVLLPAWLQAGAYTAEHDRFVGTALLSPGTALTGRGGVRRAAGDEFQVKANSPATMTLQVNPGMAFVQGVYTATQGTYVVVNDAVFNLTIITAHATLSRIDLVVLEILDSTYAGSSNLAQVRVLQGTAASSPAPPTAAGSYIVLAQVLVPPSATSIVDGNITDLRPFSGGLGAPIPVRNVTERNNLANKYDGLTVFMMDNAYEIQTYAGGEWYGSTTRYYGVTTAAFVMDSPTDYNARTLVDRAKIPDPGFRYALRLDTDIFHSGARVNGTVYCEPTTTTAFSNEVAAGLTLDADSLSGAGADAQDRLRIHRVFAQTHVGNRWVTLRVVKDTSESAGLSYTLSSYKFSFMITMMPVRPSGFVVATSVGGQP